MSHLWDYLVVTASNDSQARAYEAQLRFRRELGMLPQAENVLVVADPGGVRIGSGGSTLYCLAQIVNQEIERRALSRVDVQTAEKILRELRILIIHAGGDSKRLPAYGPCGKIFVPLPGESKSALGPTLFDRLASSFLSMPEGTKDRGQVVVASGDALLLFDPNSLDFSRRGLTALANYATPEEARKHGVFCIARDGELRVYLQKPSPEEQMLSGAIDASGRTLLDLGVMSWDAETSAHWFRIFQIVPDENGKFGWSGAMEENILKHGLDLYREICCAMGTEATAKHYVDAVRSSGSTWDNAILASIFPALHEVPMHVSVLQRCGFLHFGTTRQLVESGRALIKYDGGPVPANSLLCVNVEVRDGGKVTGSDSWVENCRVSAPFQLTGANVAVGLDVNEPLTLPELACIDVLPGSARDGRPVFFVRCYGIGDAFKDAMFCGRPLVEWLAAVGAEPENAAQSLWDARVFPAVDKHEDYRKWLWMFAPECATPEQKKSWLKADRYSAEEIAVLYRQTC